MLGFIEGHQVPTHLWWDLQVSVPRTPRSRTERTWWKAVAFCPLESFASNLGMIPRGFHDHDLFLNFQGMIQSVKKRH
jgi:hypothetical protein